MNSWYLWSKKIHRLNMWLMLVLGGVMMATGLTLRYAAGFSILGIRVATVRWLHRETSVWFAMALLVMMATGMVMYLYPYIVKWRAGSGKNPV